MICLLYIGIPFLIVLFSYFIPIYLKTLNARKRLSLWLPSGPRIPVLGSVLELGDTTKILQDMERLTNNPSKTIYLEMGFTPTVVTKNYDLAEFVLTSPTILNKGEFYKPLNPWLGEGLLLATGKTWKSHRKVITPAFHFSILEQFVDVFDANVNVMVQKLKREGLGKDSVDIYKYVNACALDIICETAMGLNIDAQNNENQDYMEAVKSMCAIAEKKAISLVRNNDFLYKVFCNLEYKKELEHLQTLHNFTNSVIEKRKKELALKNTTTNSAKEDDLGRKKRMAFLDLLLNTTIEGKPLTHEEIRSEVDTFMFAGHDTTSSATSSAFFVLAKHPEIQKQIRDELKSIFGKERNRPITYQDLQEMKYLDLVVKEVLRLYPPACLISRYTDKELEFKGQIIPKHTNLTIFLYGINRDPDYHKDSEEFNPERFTDTGEKRPFSFLPFSAGPRNCIGQKFALLEFKTMVAKTLMNFEIVSTNPPHKILLCNEIVLKSKNGFLVKLKEVDWNS